MTYDLNKTNVKIKLVPDVSGDTTYIPQYAHKGDAGADVRSRVDEWIPAWGTVLIPLGFCVSLPHGYEMQIRPKSGLALKNQLTITNSPGTIDEGYISEVCAIVTNLAHTGYQVKKGQKIAQAVIKEVQQYNFVLVEKLDETERGEGGFGSTGL